MATLPKRAIGVVLGVLALGTLTLSTLHAQVATPSQAPVTPEVRQAPPAESGRKTSTPYEGDLSVFEGADRARNLQIDRVMDLLGIGPGSTVADIGAGSGWFSVLAAKRVGPEGRVWAVDISKAAVDHIAKRAVDEGLPQIVSVLGKTADPQLPPAGIDAALILKTYHEFEKPVTMMHNLRIALRGKGLVGIIDKTGTGTNHGVPVETIIDECRLAGFELAGTYDFVASDGVDYLLVFRPVAK